MCSLLALACVCLAAFAQTTTSTTPPANSYWDKNDPQTVKTLTNRRALVGFGCLVNRTGSGIQVLSGGKNITAVTDEDLTNYASIQTAVDLKLGVATDLSVLDMHRTYSKGTQAGFVLTNNSSNTVLDIKVLSNFRVWFYLNGKKVGEASPSTGGTANLLNINLVQIGGSSSDQVITTDAPANFDEIELVETGLKVGLGHTVNVKYAFVGSPNIYTLTYNSENGVAKYLEKNGKQLKDVKAVDYVFLTDRNLTEVTDADLTNSSQSKRTTVSVTTQDGSNAFPAGTLVGFKYDKIDLKLLSWGKMEFLDKDNKSVGSVSLGFTLAGVDVSKSKNEVVYPAPAAFSSVRLSFEGLTFSPDVYYAFIQDPVDKGEHRCDIAPTANLALCDCDNQYQLTAKMPVTWSLVSKPGNSSATVDETSGLLTGLDEAGQYVVRATAKDCPNTPKCYQDVTINYGITPYSPSSNGEHYWVNQVGGNADGVTYTAGAGGGGSLVSIGSGLKNAAALITPELNDVAYDVSGLSLAEVKPLAFVKRSQPITTTGTVKVGLVVSVPTDVLNAKLLDFFSIGLKKGGSQVKFAEPGSSIATDLHNIKSANLLTASLAGTDGKQRIRYEIEVPAGVTFDEITLFSAGVLKLSLNELDLYYAYDATGDEYLKHDSPVYGAQIVSVNNTGASLSTATGTFTVLNIGSGILNVANLIDDSNKTYATLPVGVQAVNGCKIAVNIGKTVPANERLTLEMQRKEIVLSANVGTFIKMDTYLNGVKQESVNNWKVLGANVLGGENKTSYVAFTATKPFDEVVITPGNAVSALDDLHLNALYLSGDANHNGVPDENDPQPCTMDLVLNEDKTLSKDHDYTLCKMIYRRTFSGGHWNSIVLPVSLTYAQFKEAFGNRAKLAEIKKYDSTTSGGTTTDLLHFQLVSPSSDTETMMTAGTPYIIWLPADEVSKHSSEEKYLSYDEGTISGPYYIVTDGLSFDHNNVPQAVVATASSTVAGVTSVTYKGTYRCKEDDLNAGDYVFAGGDLVGLSQTHHMKAYRAWLQVQTSTGAKPNFGFMVDGNGTADAIRVIHADEDSQADDRLYNLAGQRLNEQAKMHPGVYILNGKKFIVK